MIVTQTIYLLRIKTDTYIKNIALGLESLMQAPKYKQLYLINQAKYNACQKQLIFASNKTNNTETQPEILSINWPDYGYIIISNPKRKSQNNAITQNSLITDSKNNLIAFVTDSYNYISIAKTLFVPKMRIPVYIKESRAFGILENQNGSLIIKNISIIHPVKKGQHIYLLDSKYPTNILVGTVDKVFKSPQSAMQSVKVNIVYTLGDMIYIKNLKIIKPSNYAKD